MNNSLKVLVATFLALPFAASADWNLLIAPANAPVELGEPGVLEMRITNTGADASPAMDLQAGTFVPLQLHYQVNLVSGECGPWRDETALIIFPANINVARIAIPAIAPGSGLLCRYSFIARRADSQNFRLAFVPIARPNAPFSLINIGALTDLGATANLLSSRIEDGRTVNRYRINVYNLGPNSVAEYGFGTCTSPPIGFAVRFDFPGACPESNASPPCFMSGFGITAGAVAANQSASCEIETIGPSNPGLGVLTLLDDQIGRSDGRTLLDINSGNDGIRIITGIAAMQVPTLSWLGLIGLIFGVALVARHAK